MKAAVPADDDGALMLFVTALTTVPMHHSRAVRRVENNLNIANMDWDDFADAADEGGVFRGFGQ